MTLCCNHLYNLKKCVYKSGNVQFNLKNNFDLIIKLPHFEWIYLCLKFKGVESLFQLLIFQVNVDDLCEKAQTCIEVTSQAKKKKKVNFQKTKYLLVWCKKDSLTEKPNQT